MAAPSLLIFSGNANLELASNIAHELNVPMGKAIVGRFSDGEVMVEIMENVRGRDIYLIQPTCAPAADNFMELLVMNSEMDELIARGATLRELRAAAIANEYRPLAQEGLRRVADGTTSLPELARSVDLTGRHD